jgi:hypothetical protein
MQEAAWDFRTPKANARLASNLPLLRSMVRVKWHAPDEPGSRAMANAGCRSARLPPGPCPAWLPRARVPGGRRTPRTPSPPCAPGKQQGKKTAERRRVHRCGRVTAKSGGRGTKNK